MFGMWIKYLLEYNNRMKNACAPFASKNITILGLGLLGRGVGDAEFLAKCGAHVVVTDVKSEIELAEPVARLKRYPNVEFHLGGHREEDFTHADLVIKAAGVRSDSPEVAAARASGVEVAMSTALFAKYAKESGAKIIGVTGTRGKSTVTRMIFEILRSAGKKVIIGGNVRGVSTLAMLPEVSADTIAVLELDSWQLQGFGDLGISPDISVFTNLMPDHQNYYPDMDAYFSDKANIFKFQKNSDALFVGKDIFEKVSAARPPVTPHVPPPIPDDQELKIPGAHNRENASFASAALRALGVSEKDIRDGLGSFEAVEGRLQFVREMNGIKIYNDNNATTPEATIAALRSLDTGKQNIHLIAGGSDKGLALSSLVGEIERTCEDVYLLGGTGTVRLQEELPAAKVFSSLEDALAAAIASTDEGDIILFSPAFASFGMFKNEYERNDRFLGCVRGLEAA
jgi:UDP-N-acetylmuramoylalanine--D-glutamate ligase